MNILGTDYDLRICDYELRKEGLDGSCSAYEKRIDVRPIDQMLEDSTDWEAKYKRYKEVIRHETIHAFLHETGMEKYEEDEDIVAWIARMYPKLAETFKQLNCEG